MGLDFDRARALLAADPAGVVGAVDGCELDVGVPRCDAGALAVPLRLRHLDGPLRHLAADLRLGRLARWSELAVVGRYVWEPSHRRYGTGFLAHRAVGLLVSDLLAATALALERRDLA
jgi:hypothetical protein